MFESMSKLFSGWLWSDSSLNANSLNLEALYEKANSFYENHKYEDALKYAEELLKIDHKYLGALFIKAGCFYWCARKLEAIEYLEKTLAVAEEVLKVHKSHVAVLRLKATCLIWLKRDEEAIVCLDEILKIHRKDFGTLSLKADLLKKVHRDREAVKCSKRALACAEKYLKRCGKDLHPLYIKAKSLSEMGRYEEALLCVEEALKLDPKDVYILSVKANVLISLAKYEDGGLSAEEALRVAPRFMLALLPKANSSMLLAKYEEALLCAEEILKIDEKHENALYIKARSLCWLKRFDEALLCAKEALKIDPQYVDVLFVKANVLMLLAKYEEAVSGAEEVLKINGKHIKAWYVKAASLSWLNKFDEALICAEEGLKIDSKDVDSLFVKTNILRLLGKYEEAVLCAEEALKAEPKNVNFLFTRLNLLDALQRYTDVLSCAEELLEIDEKHINARYAKANALRMLERYDEALLIAEEGAKLDPSNFNIFYVKAFSLYKLGDYQSARHVFDQALNIQENDVKCLMMQGIIAACLANYDASLKYFEEVLAIDPTDDSGLQGRAILYFFKGRKEEGSRVLEEVNRRVENSASKYEKIYMWNQCGDIFFTIKEYAYAKNAFEKVLVIDPQNFYTQRRLGDINFTMRQQKVEEKERIECAPNLVSNQRREDMNEPTGKEVSYVEMIAMEELLRKHEYAEAQAYAEALLVRESKNTRAVWAKIKALRSVGKCEEALVYLEETLKEWEINSDHLEFLREKALLLIKLKRYEKALSEINLCLLYEEENPLYYRDKGLILFLLGKYDEAVGFYVQALYLTHSSFPSAAVGKAVCLFLKGDIQACDTYIKEAEESIKDYDLETRVALNDEEGELFLGIKIYDRAKAAFEKVLAIDSENTNAKKRLEEIATSNPVPAQPGIPPKDKEEADEESDAKELEKEKPEGSSQNKLKEKSNEKNKSVFRGNTIENDSVDVWDMYFVEKEYGTLDEEIKNLIQSYTEKNTFSEKVIKIQAERIVNDDFFCNVVNTLDIRFESDIQCDGCFEIIHQKYEDAIELLKKKGNPKHAGYKAIKYMVREVTRKFHIGIECASEVLESDPQNPYACFVKANLLRILGEYEQVVEYVDTISDLCQPLVLLKADSLRMQGRYQEAIDCANSALNAGDNATTVFVKTDSLIMLGKYEEVIQLVKKYLIISPLKSSAWLLMAYALWKLGRFEEAINCIDEALAMNVNSTVISEVIWFVKFNSLVSLGLYKEATNFADKSFFMLQTYNPSWYVAETSLKIQVIYKETIQSLDQILEHAPNSFVSWIVKGELLTRLSQYEDAVTCANEALKLSVNDARVWCVKAFALMAQNKVDPAVECAVRAYEIGCDAHEFYTDLLFMLYFDKRSSTVSFIQGFLFNLFHHKNYGTALKCVDTILEIDSSNWFFLQTKAVLLYHCGKKVEAQYLFADVETNIGTDISKTRLAELWFIRGYLFYALGEYEQTEVAFERALLLDPNSSAKSFLSIVAFQKHLEEELLAFEAIKAIAQEEHQPEPVSPLASTPPSETKSVERPSALECVYTPPEHTSSDKTPGCLFIVYHIMGNRDPNFKVFSDHLNKTILAKHNLAVYLWHSPILHMDCEAQTFPEEWKAYCSMKKQAEIAIAGMKSAQPHGPYYLCGWSFGGALTLEIARQLDAHGDKVKYIALIDPQTPEVLRSLNQQDLTARLLNHIVFISGALLKVKTPLTDLDDAGERDKTDLIHFAFHKALNSLEAHKENSGYGELKNILYALYANYLAIYGYFPEKLFQRERGLPPMTVYIATQAKEYSLSDLSSIPLVKPDEMTVEGTSHFNIVCTPQMANALTGHIKNIAKIKLSHKLWECLERHYRTLEFGSLQFLYDDVPFDIRECDFNVSASSPNVRFDSIFEEGSTVRHALVVGDAGIGKTILSRQSTLRNIDSQIWTQKKWLFYIPLQNLAMMDSGVFETHQLVEHLLYHGIFKVFGISLEEVTTFWEFIKKDPHAICFVLDGLDELPERPHLDDVLKALFLLKTSVVVTTRDYRTNRLRMLGFTSEVEFAVKPLDEKSLREIFIPKYFKKRKKDESDKRELSGRALLAWIARYPLMQEFTKTPLHLTMLCSFWDRYEEEMEKGEMPLVDIFQLSVKNMFRRFLVHERLAKAYDLNNLTDDEIEQMTQDVSAFLALGAFERIQSWCTGFTSKHLNHLLKRVKGGKNFFPKVLDSGFLRATTKAHHDIDRNFQFNSQAMELYFGCQYVIQRLNTREDLDEHEKESLYKFIKNVRENFDPALVEILLVRELTAGGKKRFISLCAATVEKEYDFNSVRMMTCALESDAKAVEVLSRDAEEEMEANHEPEIPEELGEILYCFSSYFAEAYPFKKKKDRPDVDSKELLTYKNQIEALKVQSPEIFERVANDERFKRTYKGKEGVLHYAVRRRSVRLLELLLTLNPNITLKSDEGFTPVGLAYELKFDEAVALLNAYATIKAKRDKHEAEVKEKIVEEYIVLWRTGKLKEVDKYLEEKIVSCQKMNRQGKLAVKEMAEIFELFKYMENYAHDDVFQEAVCELIKGGQHDELTQKVVDFYDEIFSTEAVPENYRTFHDELDTIIRKERKNVRFAQNWHDALKTAVCDFEHNKPWLSGFIQNALKEICTDNFTKALILTHLIQKYKRNELFKKWEFTQKLKELVGHVCEKFYKDEIDTKVEKEMERLSESEDPSEVAVAVPPAQPVAAQLPFFGSPPLLPRTRVPQPQFLPRPNTGNSGGK